MKLKASLAAAALAVGVLLSGCSTDASVVDRNITTDADQFKINRRIVFVNGITDKYLMVIEGKCSINDQGQVEILCKVGENEYKKHFLGRSDNVTYFAEQLDGATVSRYHYKVIFRPEALIPDVERP
jgi:hypothetical protein